MHTHIVCYFFLFFSFQKALVLCTSLVLVSASSFALGLLGMLSDMHFTKIAQVVSAHSFFKLDFLDLCEDKIQGKLY